jgi:hypothetical protein
MEAELGHQHQVEWLNHQLVQVGEGTTMGSMDMEEGMEEGVVVLLT